MNRTGLVKMTVQRPLPMLIRYELDDAPDGTLLAIRAQGTPRRFLGFSTPVLSAQVRKRIAADLEWLRRCLEPVTVTRSQAQSVLLAIQARMSPEPLGPRGPRDVPE